jgi:hypothetical protein
MKTNQATERPLIEVSIPDYDTRFTYGLKLGEIAAFSDNNKLELADRAQLTDLVSVVNAWIILMNSMERECDALCAVAESATRALAYAQDSGLILGDLANKLSALTSLRNSK